MAASTDLVTRITEQVNQKTAAKKKTIDDFKAGDTVGVYVRVREGDKERVQLYKGVVLKIQGSGAGRAFTVRKISSGIGVERSFPFVSPNVDRVELIARGKVRRSRLYFLRGLKGKAARLTSELVGLKEDAATHAAGKAAAAEKASAAE
jgi:large subunit ribosomal protein L19